MSKVNIALDESGDLGWAFEKPYRNGGSSRHLTIACILYPLEKNKHHWRLMRDLYSNFNWNPKVEVKWAKMKTNERTYFANKLSSLVASHSDIKLFSITVRKENVRTHIRSDSNKLYNYMIGLSLLNEMQRHDEVTLIPDPRAIKVKSGNSMHDYLQTKLWFDKGSATTLKTTPIDSKTCKAIQVADMLSGVVQNHFEDGNSEAWRILSPQIVHKELYF